MAFAMNSLTATVDPNTLASETHHGYAEIAKLFQQPSMLAAAKRKYQTKNTLFVPIQRSNINSTFLYIYAARIRSLLLRHSSRGEHAIKPGRICGGGFG